MTGTELVAAWRRRDARYSMRRRFGLFLPIAREEEACIRAYRTRESSEVTDAAIALVALARWRPPLAR